MNRWGRLMHASVLTAAEMLAVGLGLERDTFSKRAHLGPHLLAPTGSDLNTYHKKGEIFAGFHYDLNFLTIHGKSRYPGLYVWKRDGSRLPVKVPDGCLIIQAGKQLEWLTGDAIRAGYHEVIVDDNTIAVRLFWKEAKYSLTRAEINTTSGNGTPTRGRPSALARLVDLFPSRRLGRDSRAPPALPQRGNPQAVPAHLCRGLRHQGARVHPARQALTSERTPHLMPCQKCTNGNQFT